MSQVRSVETLPPGSKIKIIFVGYSKGTNWDENCSWGDIEEILNANHKRFFRTWPAGISENVVASILPVQLRHDFFFINARVKFQYLEFLMTFEIIEINNSSSSCNNNTIIGNEMPKYTLKNITDVTFQIEHKRQFIGLTDAETLSNHTLVRGDIQNGADTGTDTVVDAGADSSVFRSSSGFLFADFVETSGALPCCAEIPPQI